MANNNNKYYKNKQVHLDATLLTRMPLPDIQQVDSCKLIPIALHLASLSP